MGEGPEIKETGGRRCCPGAGGRKTMVEGVVASLVQTASESLSGNLYTRSENV